MPELALNVFALQALSSIYTQPSEAAEALPIEFVANFLVGIIPTLRSKAGNLHYSSHVKKGQSSNFAFIVLASPY